MTRIGIVAAICAGLVGAGNTGAGIVQRKLDAIESGRVKPGSTVLFTPGEINSWVGAQTAILASHGVRDVRLEFEAGRITASAQIDFLKARQAGTGEAPGRIATTLLAGERPVTVTVRVDSRDGEARVDVERLEISGVAIEGPALDFLIRAYVIPEFPAAKVDEWFDLNLNVNRIGVSPRGVSVYARRG